MVTLSSSVFEAFVAQIRVIAALLLRETRVTFGSSQLGYLWALIMPCVGIMVLTIIWSAVRGAPPYGTSYVAFFATGFMPYELNAKLRGSLMLVFEANKAMLNYPLVQPLDAVIARSVLIFLTYSLVVILLFGGIVLFDIADSPARIVDFILALIVTALLGVGVGMTYAVIMRFFKTWKQIEQILSRPLFFMSGIFFVPSIFPPEVRDILYWNPIMHCIEWFREGYFKTYDSVVLDKHYLIMFTIISLVVGLGSDRLYQKHRY